MKKEGDEMNINVQVVELVNGMEVYKRDKWVMLTKKVGAERLQMLREGLYRVGIPYRVKGDGKVEVVKEFERDALVVWGEVKARVIMT